MKEKKYFIYSKLLNAFNQYYFLINKYTILDTVYHKITIFMKKTII